MKALKILLSVVMVVAFVLSIVDGIAMAVNVTISGAVSGTYTLNSMSIDSSGNITLNVSGSTPPPPGTLTLGLTPTTLPAGTVGIAYNQTVTMTASGGTSPYNYSCSGSGVAGITASNSGNTCTISGTPTAPGTYTVTFSVTDSATASAASASSSISFNVNSSTPPPSADCIDITPYKYPKYSPDISIPSQGVQNYCFTIDSDAKNVQITMSSRDWWTSSHVFLSDKGNPTKEEILKIINSGSNFNTYPNLAPWYNMGAGSNERVYVYKYPGQKGQRFYVTVFNTEPSATSLIQLYWIIY